MSGATMMMADGLYGPSLTPQPTSSGAVTHQAGMSPSHARTVAQAGKGGILADPIFFLVAMLAIGILVLHLSFSGSITIKEGK